MLASCSRAPAGPSLAAVAHMALDVPALQLRELLRTWRVTTSPRGRPIATAQSACPGPRKSMVPVGSRCCRPQAPGQGAGAQVSRASGWSTPSRTGLGVSTLGEEAGGGGGREEPSQVRGRGCQVRSSPSRAQSHFWMLQQEGGSVYSGARLWVAGLGLTL